MAVATAETPIQIAPVRAKPERFAQWLTADAKRWMRTVGATLEITVKTKRGMVSSTSFVSNVRREGKLVGWQMTRPTPDGEDVIQYDINANGELHDASWWTCTCDDYNWRSRRRQVPVCKHIRGLAHALVHIGLLPPETVAKLETQS